MRAWLVLGVGLCLGSLASLVSAQAATLETHARTAPGEPPSGDEEAATPVEPTEQVVSTLLPSVSEESEPAAAASSGARERSSALRALARVWSVAKVLPILFYTPETSVGFGAGMLFQFRLPGAPPGRRLSNVTLGAVYTLENQTLAQLTPELRFGDERYLLRLDALAAKFPNRFYGIGNEPDFDDYDTFTDTYVRAELDLRMRPFSRTHVLADLFIGAHYSLGWSTIADVAPSEPGRVSMFARMDDPGEHPLLASGVGPSVAWDSRDSLNWPAQGSFVELKATTYQPALGSDVRYHRLLVDARRFQPLWGQHVLALRLVAQGVWGDVPFQRQPQLGGAAMFRGWYTGQLRGPRLIAIEAEYRIPIGERWAVVAFGSAGRVGEHVSALSLKGTHLAGGGGLRLSVDKRDRVNIRFDLAYGDSLRPYLQFREAF